MLFSVTGPQCPACAGYSVSYPPRPITICASASRCKVKARGSSSGSGSSKNSDSSISCSDLYSSGTCGDMDLCAVVAMMNNPQVLRTVCYTMRHTMLALKYCRSEPYIPLLRIELETIAPYSKSEFVLYLFSVLCIISCTDHQPQLFP